MRAKKIRSVFGIAFTFVFLLVAFQNCSGGFTPVANSNLALSFEADSFISPKIEILSAPPALSNQRVQKLSFKVLIDPKLKAQSITCQVDSLNAEDCSSLSLDLAALVDGDHSVTIAASDSNGQVAAPIKTMFRIDATAPVAAFTQAVSTISGPEVSLAFTATDSLSGIASFECSLDSGAFATCVSPKPLTALANGSHSLSIRAKDLAGNVSTNVTQSWTASSSAPSLSLTSKPSSPTNSQSARFVFAGTLAGQAIQAFQCSINNTAFAACTSPVDYASLMEGTHLFKVRANNAAGQPSTEVTYTWKVDLTAPVAPVVTANVMAMTSQKSASLVFSATDAGGVASYQCSLDDAGFTACTSPTALTNLADGTHTFRVKAVDSAANISPIGTFSWTVDSTAPSIAITSQPASTTSDTSAQILFSATDAGSGIATVECQLDASTYAACTSPKSLTNIAAGMHVFRVRAIDKVGNQKVAEASWVVMAGTIDGAALYANNCAGCHGPLSSSAKIGRTAVQINSAIGSIAQMSGLKSLSSDQITAIAAALTAKPATEPSAPSAAFTCTNPAALSITPTRRLSKIQFVNTLTNLFGASVVSSLSAQLAAIQTDQNFENADSYVKNFYQSNIKTFFDIASAVATSVNANTTLQSQIGGSCLATSAPAASCYTAFASNFGLKVFRRPLSSDENSILSSLINASGTKAEKISAVLEFLLQSPDFLYLIESGTSGNGSASAPLVLSSYEIASRLSYMVWDTMPDDTLFALAAQGQLTNPSVQQQQIDRLFADARAREKLKLFTSYWLSLNDTPHAMRDFPTAPAAYLNGVNPSGLKSEVIREAQEYVDYVTFVKNGNYSDLMTSTASFARTDTLAGIYGHSKVTSTTPANMGNGRRGLLTRSMFLASNSSQSSTIIRGVRTRSRILCVESAPPAGDVTTLGPDVGTEEMIKMYSARQRYDLKTSGNACIGCHSSINPFGAAFETFDTFGRLRTTETNYRIDGSVIATHPIDSSAQIDLGAGVKTVSGADQLISDVAQNSLGSSCLVRQQFRYYQLQSESAEDQCVLNAMNTGLVGSGGTIQGSLKQMVLKSLTLKRVN